MLGMFNLALLQARDAAQTGMGMVGMVFWLGFIALIIVSMWKVFEKAGEPGWASIVPIYNLIVLLRIADKPLWWLILMIIPIVNLIVFIIVPIAIAQRFGKGVGYGLGLAFLGFLFYPMLAFGDARYSRA